MDLKHYDHDGNARFVTFCTHARLPILTNNRFRYAVVDAIRQVRKDSELRLNGYVIMPEHVHLVLIPPNNVKLGPVIGEIKRVSAKKILEQLRASNSNLLKKLQVKRDRQGPIALWQRRCYDHNCRTEAEMWKAVRYCDDNPVSRGLASKPEHWVWSSYGWYHDIPGVVLEMDIRRIGA
jgi:putative transposase